MVAKVYAIHHPALMELFRRASGIKGRVRYVVLSPVMFITVHAVYTFWSGFIAVFGVMRALAPCTLGGLLRTVCLNVPVLATSVAFNGANV